jgi:drug/metabolite transporter (DMT)-like permease
VLLAVGALLLTCGALFVLLAIVYALSLVVAAWAAALIVGVAVGVIAVLCLTVGLRRIRSTRAAPKTAATLKENVEWAKQLTR